jgi:4-hydroxybenzoate polyprenyltransferase/phosphoserine phosphatase
MNPILMTQQCSERHQPATKMPVPLFVDLDETLIRVDLLVESASQLLCRKPWLVLPLAAQVLAGDRSRLKDWLAERTMIDPTRLPYRQEVLDLIAKRRSAGATVVLATASHRKHAEAIAAHLGCFDHVLATNGGPNLKAAAKLAAIRKELDRIGADRFDYVGDCEADLPIFQHADQSFLFGHSHSWPARCLARLPETRVIGNEPPDWRNYLRQLRPHQWSKNALLLVPLFLAHKWLHPELLMPVLLAIVCFCLAASGVYAFNDFVDVERDRRHPTKRFRPLAGGTIPLWQAPFIAAALLMAGVGGAFWLLGPAFALILVGYVVINGAYSGGLKRKPIIDVVLLTLMYVIRILAGGVAADLPVTDWLLSFGLFFFLSLAFGKRYQELAEAKLGDDAQGQTIRGYQVGDLSLIESAGISSGLVAVLVLALFLRSPDVTALYHSPRLLWLLCPLILYWLGRFWIVTIRGTMHDDPVIFALKDRTSYVIGLFMASIVLAAHAFTLSF